MGKFETLLEIRQRCADSDEIIDFIDREIDKIIKKDFEENRKSRITLLPMKNKRTHQEAIRILTILEESGESMTVSNIYNELAKDDYLMNRQKISAILSYLKQEGFVERECQKKLAYFSLKEN